MSVFFRRIPAYFTYSKYNITCFPRIRTLFIVNGKKVCNLHAYSPNLQYMEDTGRSKMRQEFWSFRGFRTKINRVRMRVGDFPTIPHDNENVD